jgi:hypothetical protein
MNLEPHQSTADAVFAAALHARLLALAALSAELDVFLNNCVAGPLHDIAFNLRLRTFRGCLAARVVELEAKEKLLSPISLKALIQAGFSASTERRPPIGDVGRLTQL